MLQRPTPFANGFECHWCAGGALALSAIGVSYFSWRRCGAYGDPLLFCNQPRQRGRFAQSHQPWRFKHRWLRCLWARYLYTWFFCLEPGRLLYYRTHQRCWDQFKVHWEYFGESNTVCKLSRDAHKHNTNKADLLLPSSFRLLPPTPTLNL